MQQKKYITKRYVADDGHVIKAGLSLLGILRHSQKDQEHDCEICNKKIEKNHWYVILNDLNPYYWHAGCLVGESPDFWVVYRTKDKTQGLMINRTLFVGSLKEKMRDRFIL